MGEIRKVLPRSGSLQVTIPRRWCRALGLVRGGFVELTFMPERNTVEVKALKEVKREAATTRNPD